MEQFSPAERRQVEMIWKPVYDEYRRIGYRLTEDKYENTLPGQIEMRFDFNGNLSLKEA